MHPVTARIEAARNPTGAWRAGFAAKARNARPGQFATMLARLIGLLLMTIVISASAQSDAGAPLAAALPAPADWKALACAVLVVVYIALRRSRWRME